MADQSNEKEPKKILILKRNAQSLTGAEKYLIKRGWQVVSTHDLKVTVLKAVEFKPDYVLLAFDHQNQKVINLPKVFKQIMQTVVVPFLETQSTFSMHLIKQSGYVYSLVPPITGPKVERLIHKIVHDKLHPQTQTSEDQPRQAFGVKKNDKDEMTIKIKGASGFDPTDQKSSHISSLLNSELMSGGSGVKFDPAMGSFYSDEDLNSIMTTTPTESLAEMMPEVQKLSTDTSESFRQRLCEQLIRKNSISAREDSERAFLDEVYSKALELFDERNGDTMIADMGEGGEPRLTKDLLEQALKEMMEFCPDSMKKTEYEKEDSHQRRMIGLLLRQMKRNQIDVKQLEEEFEIHFKTVLASSSFQTLRFLKENSKQQDVQKFFATTTSARCFMIDSGSFYGYLILAAANLEALGDEINSVVEKMLKQYLKEHGHEVEISERLSVQFQEVDFQALSSQKAEFLYKSVQEGQEVAMAYFPTNQKRLEVKESKGESMAAVDISEFMGGVPVEFNLYVHLKQNDKFVRYTKSGFVLYENQRSRLEEKGIAEMHVEKDEIHQLKKYRVQNYLNTMIKDYNSKGKKANAG